jgi:hypothetical protein
MRAARGIGEITDGEVAGELGGRECFGHDGTSWVNGMR